MLRCLSLFAAPLALAVVPGAAVAAELSAGVSAGTLAAGPEVGVRLTQRVGIRANAMLADTGVVDIEASSDDLDFGSGSGKPGK